MARTTRPPEVICPRVSAQAARGRHDAIVQGAVIATAPKPNKRLIDRDEDKRQASPQFCEKRRRELIGACEAQVHDGRSAVVARKVGGNADLHGLGKLVGGRGRCVSLVIPQLSACQMTRRSGAYTGLRSENYGVSHAVSSGVGSHRRASSDRWPACSSQRRRPAAPSAGQWSASTSRASSSCATATLSRLPSPGPTATRACSPAAQYASGQTRHAQCSGASSPCRL